MRTSLVPFSRPKCADENTKMTTTRYATLRVAMTAGLISSSHAYLRADSPLILVFQGLTSRMPLIERRQVPIRMLVIRRGEFLICFGSWSKIQCCGPRSLYVALEMSTLRYRRLILARWGVVSHKVDASLLIKAYISVSRLKSPARSYSSF